MDVEEVNVYYNWGPDILVDQILVYLDLTQFKPLKHYMVYDIYMVENRPGSFWKHFCSGLSYWNKNKNKNKKSKFYMFMLTRLAIEKWGYLLLIVLIWLSYGMKWCLLELHNKEDRGF